MSAPDATFFVLLIPKRLPKRVALTEAEQRAHLFNQDGVGKIQLKAAPERCGNNASPTNEEGGENDFVDVKGRITTGLGLRTQEEIFVESAQYGYRISFRCRDPNTADIISEYLKVIGVGTKYGSLHISQCSRSYSAVDFFGDSCLIAKTAGSSQASRENTGPGGPTPDGDTSAENVNLSLVGERLYMEIKNASALTPDYVLLTILASVIAGIALAANNTVVIVASMLVSPLMGPILAITYGMYDLRYIDLVFPAVMVELIALGICLACGFVVGLLFAPWGDRLSWPNPEMEGRGHVNGLYIGIAIAIPSGLAASSGIASNNAASLVGVAISASLLPPAVNCGLCCAYAMFGEDLVLPSQGGLKIKVDSKRFYNLGGISFALTILNIVCIILVAHLWFGFKKTILDRRSKSPNTIAAGLLGKQKGTKTIKANRPSLAVGINNEDATSPSSLRNIFRGGPAESMKAGQNKRASAQLTNPMIS